MAVLIYTVAVLIDIKAVFIYTIVLLIYENIFLALLQLLHCMRAGMEWYEELEDVCQQKGIKDTKFDKV